MQTEQSALCAGIGDSAACRSPMHYALFTISLLPIAYCLFPHGPPFQFLRNAVWKGDGRRFWN